MQAKLLIALMFAGLLLEGCATDNKPAPVEPPDEAGHAAKCEVTPSPVPVKEGAAVDVKMTVGNDGGWCAVRLSQVKAGLLRVPPQNGKVYFHNVRDLTRLEYTPRAGFAGADAFTFQLVPGNATVRTTVTVEPR